MYEGGGVRGTDDVPKVKDFTNNEGLCLPAGFESFNAATDISSWSRCDWAKILNPI